MCVCVCGGGGGGGGEKSLKVIRTFKQLKSDYEIICGDILLEIGDVLLANLEMVRTHLRDKFLPSEVGDQIETLLFSLLLCLVVADVCLILYNQHPTFWHKK